MFQRTLKADNNLRRGEGAAEREVSRGWRRFRPSRKQLIIALLIILPLAAGVWIYVNRPEPVVIASYVPGTALGYFEVNDWSGLIDNLTSTKAWRELAPAYGVPGELNYLGKIGRWDWIARLTGWGEAAMLARSQFAVAITGLEVRGEQVKPRMALIAETHSDADSLREVAGKRLEQFAGRAFGRISKQNEE